jgi:formamidopyrimidine-DNA glycosylase
VLDDDETLIIHLGMSGRMLIGGAIVGEFVHDADGTGKHDHVVFEIEGGARVVFNDARRFGAMDLWPTSDLTNHKLLSRLGPEPLSNEFDEIRLANSLSGKKAPIKSALLDQRIVAGLGNIYVCEALHRSGISPTRQSGAISEVRIAALTREIRSTLHEAIAAGGSSLKDYRRADGELGYFQHSFKVYGREDQPCSKPNCGGFVRRIVQSGRSSFYCSTCQR